MAESSAALNYPMFLSYTAEPIATLRTALKWVAACFVQRRQRTGNRSVGVSHFGLGFLGWIALPFGAWCG
jgi:hypothetical protein